MSLLVVGTGALACLFAARLAGAGQSVTMLGSWPAGLSALRERGLMLLDLNDIVHEYWVEVADYGDRLPSFTKALVLVKSWQTTRVARQLEACLDNSGIALTLQNGLGNVETLQAVLGQERVALGVTTTSARMLEPGYVMHTGEGKVSLGAHPNLADFEELLQSAGFVVETIADPQSLLWGKLVINAAINPLTALLRVSNGELLERPAARALMQEAATEAALVAAAKGIKLPYTNPVEAVEAVAKNTSPNTSSMLMDVLRGTPTEIDAISGAIIKESEKAGLPAPVNRMLWRLVSGLDRH
jgi:2-dehydropantoate 2-reductase